MAVKKFDLSVIISATNRTGRATKGVTSNLNRIRNVANRTTQAVLAIGGAAAVALPIIAVKSANDFNAAMARIATLIPNNLKRVKELKKGIQEMSIDVNKSTSDLADGAFQIISAFGDTPETLSKLNIAATAATGGLASTSAAVDLASLVTKAYGDTSAKSMEKVLDLAFQINKLGVTTFPELAANMGRTAPIAAALGVSIEELAGMYATLTGASGNTSEVTTQITSIFTGVIKQTELMKLAFAALGEEQGVSINNASDLIKHSGGLFKGLRRLYDLAKGKEELISEMFGRKEAFLGLQTLIRLQGDFERKTAKMQKVAGSAAEAFNEVAKGINKTGFELERAGKKTEVLSQKIGEALLPAAKIGTEEWNKFLETTDKSIEETFGENAPKNFETSTKQLKALDASMKAASESSYFKFLDKLRKTFPGLIPSAEEIAAEREGRVGRPRQIESPEHRRSRLSGETIKIQISTDPGIKAEVLEPSGDVDVEITNGPTGF